jgi:hypothetical protein
LNSFGSDILDKEASDLNKGDFEFIEGAFKQLNVRDYFFQSFLLVSSILTKKREVFTLFKSWTNDFAALRTLELEMNFSEFDESLVTNGLLSKAVLLHMMTGQFNS